MNMHTAASQYANRPKDERFGSVEALIEHSKREREASRQTTYNLKELTIVPTQANGDLYGQGSPTLTLASPKGRANFTHWSFNQFARSIGAPASYLRTLPPSVAADAMNFGIQQTDAGTAMNLLLRAPKNGEALPTVRAGTSEKYARLWDVEIYEPLNDALLSKDSRWQLPLTWEGPRAGAYAGDRDSFLIVTNGGSIVNDPSAGANGAMFRGLMVRNSEVGGGAVSIEHILFRYICGNHILWGAVMDKRFRRRHFGHNTRRDVLQHILWAAANFAESSPGRDEAIIRNLISHEIATTEAGVVDELKALGFTKDKAQAAYDACKQHEQSLSPRSFWGLIQGATRVSQESGFQDERLQLDRLAAQLLKRGAALVTV